MSEWNLSDKQIDMAKMRSMDIDSNIYEVIMGEIVDRNYFRKEDVKEFIRRLKEKAEEYGWEGSEVIDILAGERLI